MCPVPPAYFDFDAHVNAAIAALKKLHGHDEFSSWEVAQWVEKRRAEIWADWLADYEAEIDHVEPGELEPHVRT